VTTTVCVPDAGFADRLRAAAPEAEVVVWDGHAEPPPELDRVSVVVPPYPKAGWTAEQFTRLPAAAVLQVLSAGTEAWLPLAPPGLTICNGRGVHGSSTAELAVTGLLSHWHALPALAEQQRAHRWEPVQAETAWGRHVVVVGAGDIARTVAAALQVFGARTTLCGRTARDGVAAVADLPELCATADALVLAVPLDDATRGLVDAALLARLPDSAVVVNVARGPIVDTAALLAELVSGRLRAVLDVTDPEPLPADHPLWAAPGLVLTPHVGGGAVGWRDRAGQLVADQVRRWLDGRPLENVVRPGTATTTDAPTAGGTR
jgi:phosphoglycerate dehydrogenase-like enzyme